MRNRIAKQAENSIAMKTSQVEFDMPSMRHD